MQNKPKLRFKEFNDEWREYKLKNLVSIYDGTHQTPKYVDNGVKFLSVENIKDIDDSCKFITQEAFVADFKIKPEKDNILMTRIGDIGTPAIITSSKDYAYYVSLALFKCDKNKIKPQYLMQQIYSDKFQHELWKRTLHVAFPKKINKNEIGECRLKICSLSEQQKIAGFLSKVDELILEQEARAKDLEQKKKGLMQKLFSDQLRFTNSQNQPYPDWEDKQIFECFEIKAGGDIDPKKCTKQMTEENKYPVFANALKEKGLYGYTNTYKISGETITVTGRGDVGFAVARYEKYYPIVRLLVLKPLQKFNVIFFANMINMTKIFVESTGVPQLTAPQLSKVKIKTPHIEEQEKIAAVLSKMDELIEENKSLLTSWQQLKKALLQQMFV